MNGFIFASWVVLVTMLCSFFCVGLGCNGREARNPHHYTNQVHGNKEVIFDKSYMNTISLSAEKGILNTKCARYGNVLLF